MAKMHLFWLGALLSIIGIALGYPAVSAIPRAARTYSIEIYSNGAMVTADYEVSPSNSANNTAWLFLPFVPSDIGSVLLLPSDEGVNPACFVSGINYAEQEWTTSRELYENLFGRKVIVTVRSGQATENLVGTWRTCLGNRICLVNGDQVTLLMGDPERVTLVEGEEKTEDMGILLPPPAAPYPSTFTPIQVKFLNQSTMRMRNQSTTRTSRASGRARGSRAAFSQAPAESILPELAKQSVGAASDEDNETASSSQTEEPSAQCSLNSLFPIRGVTWNAQHTLRLSRDSSVASLLTRAIVKASFQSGPLPPQANPPQPLPTSSKYEGSRVGSAAGGGIIPPPPKPRPTNPHLAAVINGRRVFPSRITFMTGNIQFPSSDSPRPFPPSPQYAKRYQARAFGAGGGMAESASYDGAAPVYSEMSDFGEHQLFTPLEENLALPTQGTSTFTLFSSSESEKPRVNRRLRLNAEVIHSGYAPDDSPRAHPDVILTLNNTRANDLGQTPFPAGQLLVYRDGVDGLPHYIGMASISQDVPVGSRMDASIGPAGNVECTYLHTQNEQGMGSVWSGKVQIRCTQYATEGLLQKIRAGEEPPLIRRLEVMDTLPGPGQVIQFQSDPPPTSVSSGNKYRWMLSFDELDNDGTSSVEINYSYRTQLR